MGAEGLEDLGDDLGGGEWRAGEDDVRVWAVVEREGELLTVQTGVDRRDARCWGRNEEGGERNQGLRVDCLAARGGRNEDIHHLAADTDDHRHQRRGDDSRSDRLKDLDYGDARLGQ